MKVFGNKKRSKHVAGSSSKAHNSSGKRAAPKKKKTNIFVKIIVIILALAAALAIAGFAYWKTSVKPPDVTKKPNSSQNSSDGGSEDGDTPVISNSGDGTESTRSGEKYTFLILASDVVGGNTDGIMVCTFDTSDYSLNIVSIPRDTLVNVSWSTKKANTLYSSGGIDNLKANFADLLGYEVDFYVIMKLSTIEKVVDAIGGVDYYVPQDMKYEDPYQDLYINISKGQQVLSGSDSVKLMRFRATYAEGDIKRIEVTQDFLKVMASQVLQNVDKIPLTTLVDILVNDVKTDLTSGNILWFAKEMFKMDAENVNFYTMPGNTNDSVYHGGKWVSYVTIYVDEWLEMINEYLNPFDEDITVDDVDILTRNSNGTLYATSGEKKGSSTWGTTSSSGGSSGSSGSSSSSGSSGSTSSGSSGGSSSSGNSTSSGSNTSQPGSSSNGSGASEGSSTGDDGNNTTAPDPTVSVGEGDGGEIDDTTGDEPENNNDDGSAEPSDEPEDIGSDNGEGSEEEPETQPEETVISVEEPSSSDEPSAPEDEAA